MYLRCGMVWSLRRVVAMADHVAGATWIVTQYIGHLAAGKCTALLHQHPIVGSYESNQGRIRCKWFGDLVIVLIIIGF